MISVIIPSYNRAAVIERSARSVLDQTYTDLELIIVDDCSGDQTEAAVAALGDERVRYVRHEENRGACAARNTGIDVARGDYIAFQDSDDLWYPDKLEKQLNALETNGADCVFCKYRRLKDGSEIGIGPKQYKEGFLDPLVDVYGIGTQTLLAKREVFEGLKFDEHMPRFQELELLIRISEKYRLYCVDQPLVDYCVGSDSISRHPERLYQACSLIREKHPDVYERVPRTCLVFSGLLLRDIVFGKKNEAVSRTSALRLSMQYAKSLKYMIGKA